MAKIYGPAILFCPGDRPERFAKAMAAADCAVLDLEDGVAADATAKDAARESVCQFLRDDGTGAIVRINDPAQDRGRTDAEEVRQAGARCILIGKTETRAQIDTAAGNSDAPPDIIITIESARGVLAMADLLSHPAVAGVSWGPYDLAADMGMRAVRDDDGQLLPLLRDIRNQMLVHAAAARVPAYDTVTAELSDGGRTLESDAGEAATLGCVGKFMIHPSQTAQVRRAFQPSLKEIDHARRLLDAVPEKGAFLFEGDMVDAPMMRRARHILALAGRQGVGS
ncbi:MAG: aldolase/citrate lyase family protein [Pseudomonadota bacterium]|nr:aldolase/citrate lyase family protein [Pseudomonadota bacterium]